MSVPGNAFRLLAHYRDRACLFDDDIQGTGAVGLSGLLSALRITGEKLEDQRILFYGAGQASIGIANAVVAALLEQGVTAEQANECCWFYDTALEALRPTALIGASRQGGMFTHPVLKRMAQYHERPIIFALSNPTAKAECCAEQAYQWTDGRALFASGSRFSPVDYGNRQFISGQGNNDHIFPGVGLGVVASRSTREVSVIIAAEVARIAWESGFAAVDRPDDILTFIKASMYQPVYPHYA